MAAGVLLEDVVDLEGEALTEEEEADTTVGTLLEVVEDIVEDTVVDPEAMHHTENRCNIQTCDYKGGLSERTSGSAMDNTIPSDYCGGLGLASWKCLYLTRGRFAKTMSMSLALKRHRPLYYYWVSAGKSI